MPDILGIDTPCVDLLVNLNHLPKPDECYPMQEMSWQGGGKVATALTAAARLGASCGIIGVVGNDVYGNFCRKDFERHGVDTQFLYQQESTRTPFSLVLSDRETGSRNIIWKPFDFVQLDSNKLDTNYLAQAKYIHLSNANACNLELARWARANNIKVSYDADHDDAHLEAMLPFIDVFIASEFLHEQWFGGTDFEASLGAVSKEGPEIVVFTLGEKGCVGMGQDSFFVEPAFHTAVVDTVGAGDVFHGAFLYSLMQCWGLREAARFSNAVAAIKCTRIGGRAGMPDVETVLEFMKSGKIDYSEIDQRVAFYADVQF